MRNFTIKLILFAAILFALDFVIGKILQSARPSDYSIFLEAKQVFFKTEKDYDVLIIGDSHVADGIDPAVMEDSLYMSVFNLGIYHASPFECYYLAKAILKHQNKRPKIVILGTNPKMFNRSMEAGKYTPLIMNDFRTVLSLYYYSEEGISGEYFFSMMREKYLLKSLLKKITGKKYIPTRNIVGTYNGYVINENQIAGTDWNALATSNTAAINASQVGYFARTIEYLQGENIRVVVANTPLWKSKLEGLANDSNFIRTDRVLDSVCNAYGVDFFNRDYSLLQDSLKQAEFLNTEHLNSAGAKKYSSFLSKWIRDTQQMK